MVLNKSNSKQCNKCNEWKDYNEFYKRADYSDGHLNTCKPCCRQYRKKIYEEGGKAHRQKHKKFLEVLNADFWKQKEEEWEQMRLKNALAYRQSESGRAACYRGNQKRRSYKHKVYFKPHERKEILDRDNWTCQCCKCKVHDDKTNDHYKAHVDHIIPLSKGGDSEPNNLQILCRRCNQTKGAKIVNKNVNIGGV
jgi:5-methylcytosine-specific restriction endonuclease McrA